MSLLILQSVLTWACLSGMLVLGFHTAIQVSPEFRDLYTRWVKERMTPELQAWGQEMVRRFRGNALLFAWVYYFFLPVLMVFYPFIKYVAVVYGAAMTKRQVGTVKGSAEPQLSGATIESLKAAEKRLHAGIARVAYEASIFGFPDLPSWDNASDAVQDEHTVRVGNILADHAAFDAALNEAEKVAVTEEQKEALERAWGFHDIALACVDALQDNGINVWPVKDSVVVANDESDEEADLFPKGPTQ